MINRSSSSPNRKNTIDSSAATRRTEQRPSVPRTQNRTVWEGIKKHPIETGFLFIAVLGGAIDAVINNTQNVEIKDCTKTITANHPLRDVNAIPVWQAGSLQCPTAATISAVNAKNYLADVPSIPTIDRASPNHDDGRADYMTGETAPLDRQIDTVIIHYTAISYDLTAKKFMDPNSKVSAHFVVKEDGTIVRFVQDKDRAWHAGGSEENGARRDVNAHSIGIEIVNAGVKDGQQPSFTLEQYDAVSQLVAEYAAKYHIPKERVLGHEDVAIFNGCGSKQDPGFAWSWKVFDEKVAQKVGPNWLNGPDHPACDPHFKEAPLDGKGKPTDVLPPGSPMFNS